MEDKKNYEGMIKIFEKFNMPEKYFKTPLHVFNALMKCRVIVRLEWYHDVTDPKKYKYPKKMTLAKK